MYVQVEAAQKLGLSGKDTTVCVIDTGIDVSHPNFGACSDGIRGRACRVKFGFDAETDSRDPVSAAVQFCSRGCSSNNTMLQDELQ
jgi:subtilisin family serine protease